MGEISKNKTIKFNSGGIEVSLLLLLIVPFIVLSCMQDYTILGDLPYFCWIFYASIACPAFFIYHGYCVFKKNLLPKELVVKGFKYICGGLFYNIFILALPVYLNNAFPANVVTPTAGYYAWMGNVFFAIALIYFIFAVFKRLKAKPYIIMIISIVLSLISSLIPFCNTDNYLLNLIISLFVPAAAMGYFPVFATFIYSAFGFLFASIHKKTKNTSTCYIKTLFISLSYIAIFLIADYFLSARGTFDETVGVNAWSIFGQSMYEIQLGICAPETTVALFYIACSCVCYVILYYVCHLFKKKIIDFIKQTADAHIPIVLASSVFCALVYLVFTLANSPITNILSNYIISVIVSVIIVIVYYFIFRKSDKMQKLYRVLAQKYVVILIILFIVSFAFFVYSYFAAPQGPSGLTQEIARSITNIANSF